MPTLPISSLDTLFAVLSFVPGPLWLALAIAPKNAKAMLAFDIFLFAASLLYCLFVIPQVAELIPVIAAPTRAGIQAMLTTPHGTVAAWNHFVIGDLWIGRWMAHDSLRLRLPAVARVGFLFPTLFFGPLGLCLYLCYKFARERRISI